MSGPLEPVRTRTLHQVWMCRSIGARVFRYANFRRTEVVRRAPSTPLHSADGRHEGTWGIAAVLLVNQSVENSAARFDEAVPSVRVEIEEAPSPGGADEGDIEAIAFLVTLASHSAQDDLRAVMKQVKAITAQKNKAREALKLRPDRGL